MNIRQLVAASEALFNCKHPSVLHRGIAVCSECGAMRATDGAGQVQWLKPPLVIAIRDALQAPEDNKDA
jgi:hypothetical protein